MASPWSHAILTVILNILHVYRINNVHIVDIGTYGYSKSYTFIIKAKVLPLKHYFWRQIR